MSNQNSIARWTQRLTPKKAKSVFQLCATIQRDAVEVRHGFVVFESSIDFVRRAKVGEYSWSTAQTVYADAMRLIGAASLTLAEARGFGFPLRNVVEGKRRGGLYALTQAQYERVLDVCVAQPVSVSARGLGPEFVALRVRRVKGVKITAHCSFHADRHPSVALTVRGGTAYGQCFACAQSLFAVRRGEDWFVRVAVGAVNNRRIKSTRISGTIAREHSAPRRLPLADYNVDDAFRARLSRCYTKLRGANRVEQDFGMEQSKTHQTRLLDALMESDKRAERSRESAYYGHIQWQACGGDYRQYLPDRFVAMDMLYPSEFIDVVKGKKTYKMPRKFRSAGVTHALIDLDGFTAAPLNNTGLAALKDQFVALGKAQGWSGEVALVRTSLHGIHVVFGLDRMKKPQWYGAPGVRDALVELGARCLDLVRSVGFEGGMHDKQTLVAGRHVRRPGARIDKRGEIYVSRLAFAAYGDVSIEPRKRKVARKVLATVCN
jgi:hypothetical protein